jgi:heme-degrading monooxygenase HmoA
MIARTPEPPYFVAIFTSVRHPEDGGYGAMSARMIELVRAQPGFLGMESVRTADGHGITLSYWDSPESIQAWKRDAEHLEAQRLGRERWYQRYALRVARVERQAFFEGA